MGRKSNALLQGLDVSGVKALKEWTREWRLRIPGVRGHGDVVTREKEARCLVHLLVHYPWIVYMAFSFWRRVLILSVRTSYGDHVPLNSKHDAEDHGALGNLFHLHKILPKVFFEQRIPTKFDTVQYWDGEVDHFASFIKGVMKNNQVDVAAVLVKELQINLQDAPGRRWGQTALHQVSSSGHILIARLLLSRGANVQSLNRKQMNTPLHYAAENGHAELVQMYVKEIQRLKEENDTALHVDKINGEGKSALRVAMEAYHLPVIKVLVEDGGADFATCVDAKTGGNVLHFIANMRVPYNGTATLASMIELVLKQEGASDMANQLDASKSTALKIARANGNKAVADKLEPLTETGEKKAEEKKAKRKKK